MLLWFVSVSENERWEKMTLFSYWKFILFSHYLIISRVGTANQNKWELSPNSNNNNPHHIFIIRRCFLNLWKAVVWKKHPQNGLRPRMEERRDPGFGVTQPCPLCRYCVQGPIADTADGPPALESLGKPVTDADLGDSSQPKSRCLDKRLKNQQNPKPPESSTGDC